MTNEIETVIKNLPTNKNPGSDGFRLQMESDEFYQTFKGALTPNSWSEPTSPSLAGRSFAT